MGDTRPADREGEDVREESPPSSGMDSRMHSAQGRAVTSSVTPAAPDGKIEGIDEHGAETDEPHGGAASDEARQGAAKAFPPSSDSEYLDPNGPGADER